MLRLHLPSRRRHSSCDSETPLNSQQLEVAKQQPSLLHTEHSNCISILVVHAQWRMPLNVLIECSIFVLGVAMGLPVRHGRRGRCCAWRRRSIQAVHGTCTLCPRGSLPHHHMQKGEHFCCHICSSAFGAEMTGSLPKEWSTWTKIMYM